MQANILGPVPYISFPDGVLTVEAQYRSETGAPMEDASITLTTAAGVAVNMPVEVDGNTVSASVTLKSVQADDPKFANGQTATVTVKTTEAGVLDAAVYKSTVLLPPEVEITTPISSLTGFPLVVSWDYSDLKGFYQCRWRIALEGEGLARKAQWGAYTMEDRAEIQGTDFAYAARFDGTVESCTLTLEVLSTSGLSATATKELSVSCAAQPPSVAARFEDGSMVIEHDADSLVLYSLRDGVLEQCAAIERPTTNPDTGASEPFVFALPVSNTTYYGVSFDSKRIGAAAEVVPGGSLRSTRLDYAVDGVARSLALVLDNEETFETSSEVVYENYLGRDNPVGYYVSATNTVQAGAYFKSGLNAKRVMEELRGRECVLRSWQGGIYRVMVDTVSYSPERSFEVAGRLDLTLTEVDGSPYELLYDREQFATEQLYPSQETWPGPAVWTVA